MAEMTQFRLPSAKQSPDRGREETIREVRLFKIVATVAFLDKRISKKVVTPWIHADVYMDTLLAGNKDALSQLFLSKNSSDDSISTV
jgi:hypothetical protein